MTTSSDEQPAEPTRIKLGHLAGAAVRSLPAVAWAVVNLPFGWRRRRQGVAAARPVDRNVALARMGTEMAASGVVHRARKVVASEARKEELDKLRQARSADKVADALGEMKGLMTKIAQHESYQRSDMADPWRDALSRLQQDAPPMATTVAASVIVEELGKAPAEAFAEWDPTPLAAASVGQVHRARTHDGVDVAVKVQYPHAEDALHADVDTLAGLVRLAEKQAGGFTNNSGESPAAMLGTFRARLVQEVDYRREADNQERVREAFDGHPFVHVPRVLRELSAHRVLTTELAEGARFAEVLTWPQEERDLAGEAVFRFYYACAFWAGVYNADPHPGNYLFRRGGRVTFLDFGAVWDANPRLGDVAARVLAATSDEGGHRDDPQQALVEVSEQTVRHGAGWFLEQAVPPGPRRLDFAIKTAPPEAGDVPTVSMTEEERQVLLDELGLAKVTAAFNGMQSVVARLGAVRDWRAIALEMLPCTAAPPSTELGQEHAAWLAGRGSGPQPPRAANSSG